MTTTIILRDASKESNSIFNLIRGGYVSQLHFVKVNDLCKLILKSLTRYVMGIRDNFYKVTKFTIRNVTRTKEWHLILYLKIYLPHIISFKLVTMQIKKEQQEKIYFNISCPKCVKKHIVRECPLENINIFVIFGGEHSIDQYPSSCGWRVISHGEDQAME